MKTFKQWLEDFTYNTNSSGDSPEGSGLRDNIVGKNSSGESDFGTRRLFTNPSKIEEPDRYKKPEKLFGKKKTKLPKYQTDGNLDLPIVGPQYGI